MNIREKLILKRNQYLRKQYVLWKRICSEGFEVVVVILRPLFFIVYVCRHAKELRVYANMNNGLNQTGKKNVKLYKETGVLVETG